MPVIIRLLLVVCCVAIEGASASAAGDPQAATGMISERCASCHKVPGYEAEWGRVPRDLRDLLS